VQQVVALECPIKDVARELNDALVGVCGLRKEGNTMSYSVSETFRGKYLIQASNAPEFLPLSNGPRTRAMMGWLFCIPTFSR
jgi:hypothetical protein